MSSAVRRTICGGIQLPVCIRVQPMDSAAMTAQILDPAMIANPCVAPRRRYSLAHVGLRLHTHLGSAYMSWAVRRREIKETPPSFAPFPGAQPSSFDTAQLGVYHYEARFPPSKGLLFSAFLSPSHRD